MEKNNSAIKICMLSTGHSPVDDRIYHKEVVSLAKQYSSIIMVMPGEESDLLKNEQGIEFSPLGRMGSIFTRFFFIPKAIFKILKIRPDICHFHDYELIFALPFLRLFSRCKIIYDVHETYPEMVLQSTKVPKILRSFIAKVVDICEKRLSRLASHIIASDDRILERFHSVNSGTDTIFNYPRLSIFNCDSNKMSELKKQYQGRTPIIYQGSITEDRGLFLMIKAMAILKLKRPDLILQLVGSINENLLQQAKREIKERKLQSHIDIIGWVPHQEIVNYISISKVGLVPLLPTEKYLKNIPIKQFEYMACGVPVLGANLPPIAHYINSSRCGKVFDSTSEEALASGVLDIIQNDDEWMLMSEAGKKAVNELWNWDQMETKLLKIYERILN